MVLSLTKSAKNKIIWWGNPSDRIKRVKDQLVNSVRELSAERARYVTQSYKETENKPEILRRAKGLENALKNQTPLILPDELIVGHMTEKQGSAPFFPEMSVDWLIEEIDDLYTRSNDRFFVRPEVKKEILEDIIPYWKGRTLFDHIMAKLPDETKEAREAGVWSLSFHEYAGLGHVQLDYEYGIKFGLRSIINRLKEKLNNLDLSAPGALEKYYFYNAGIIVAEATIAFAKKYAALAEELAIKEINEARKNELLRIAEINRQVPEYPAEDLWEAIQAFWWIQLIPLIETDGASITPGRFDQYIYPYYKKSMENGMGKTFAQELVDALFIKFSEYAKIYNTASSLVAGGFPAGQNIVLGGILLGFFTPTEAGAAGSVATLIIVGVIRRELTLEKAFTAFLKAAVSSANVLLIIAFAASFGNIMARLRLPDALTEALFCITENKFLILIIINIFLAILGMVMETNSALIILLPTIVAIGRIIGIDPIQMTTMVVINFVIAGITPPVGMMLYVVCAISKSDIFAVAKEAFPYFASCVVVLGLVAVFPAVTLWLPNLLFG